MTREKRPYCRACGNYRWHWAGCQARWIGEVAARVGPHRCAWPDCDRYAQAGSLPLRCPQHEKSVHV